MADETETEEVTPVAPPQAMPPRGTGYTYSTPGPANWQQPRTVSGPQGMPVQIPQNAQNFASVVGPPPEDQETAAFRKMFNSLPMDQAIKAYQAAKQFQGQRVLQTKLAGYNAAGLPPDQALSKALMDATSVGLFSGSPKDLMALNKDFIAGSKARLQAPMSPLGKLQADRMAAVSRGDQEAVKQYDAAIQEAVTNKGKSIYFGTDDQGRPIFQMSEGGAC